jgi:hypothetical protein
MSCFLYSTLAHRTMDKIARRFSFDCCNTRKHEVSTQFRIEGTNQMMIKPLIHNSGRLLAKSQQSRVAQTH